MKSKVFKIPIYCCSFEVVLDKDLSYIEKKYNTFSLKDFGAVTLKDENKYRHYVIGFTDKNHLSNIAHEIVHLKNYIYEDCAMQLDAINDEPEAYLTGWIFETIHNFLTNGTK
jgi:hypothetical protein